MLKHKRVRNTVTINKAINTLSMSPFEYQQFHSSKSWLETFICNYTRVGMKRALWRFKEIKRRYWAGLYKNSCNCASCLSVVWIKNSRDPVAQYYHTYTAISDYSRRTMWPHTGSVFGFFFIKWRKCLLGVRICLYYSKLIIWFPR